MVAAPRTWEEIEQGAQERDFLERCAMGEVLDRVEAQGDIFGELSSRS